MQNIKMLYILKDLEIRIIFLQSKIFDIKLKI